MPRAGRRGRGVAPTDVSDPAAVDRLARAAEARFGRIDVWANIAGVGAVGPFLASPVAEHDQILRTDLLGPLYGAYAALRRFERQGAGILINMNSVGAFAAAPYGTAYSASKFGLRGLSLALRGEFARHPGVHVCEIYAAFLDTPGVEHAGDRLGVKLRPAPPVNDPDRVAAVMVDLVRRPRAEVMLDAPALAIRLGAVAAPQFTSWAAGRFLEFYAKVAERRPPTGGAVERAASNRGEVHGGLRSPPLRLAVGMTTVAAVLATLTLVLQVGGKRRPQK